MTEPRLQATPTELQVALMALDGEPSRIRAKNWPGDLGGLEMAGLYCWWVDAEGAEDLTGGLGESVKAGRIYAGQAGATSWPSGKIVQATLQSRLQGNHLRGRVRTSTFRLTVAAALKCRLDLAARGPKQLTPQSESRLSQWIDERLELAVHPFGERSALADLEQRALHALDPPLNLKGRSTSPVRAKLRQLRADIVRASASQGRKSPCELVAATGQRISL